MVVDGPAETGARARTRRAILDAAVSALSRDPASSLGDIAAAAGVGRTTVHRYFAERSDLLQALSNDALDKIAVANERARLGEGGPVEALERFCKEMFELGDLLMLIFNDPQLMACPEWEEYTEADRDFLRLVERGHAEGVMDRELSPEWVQQTLWALLYAAWSHVRENGASKFDALVLCLRTVRKSIAT
ncbi:TetR family transcriptional regulator [Herbihabitans rhizosphaerae]|uniref:TetR family transcriptional regulator n=1 Tax=Herbihabitans rhizosphaerae TaxID=1872711 RepID=A0A4Q7KDZ7_9PSEU|nr:TetR/AcrR family transcriptional regulator [Herbihabitans rhizosphaerae]RZS32464.1 TetR family transcriptional regulator [Herbihabitans rhizosphaerae]